MANKNDLSDLAEFFLVSLGIIAGIFALASYGWAMADKKYGKEVRFLEACVSSYVRQQWDEAKRVK